MPDLFECLIDESPDMAWIVFDWNYRYKVCRGPLHERLGYHREKMEGRTLYEVLGADSWDLLEPLYERALHGESFVTEFQGTDWPDVTFWVHFAPVHIDGLVQYGMAIVKDATRERQIIERKAQLKNIEFIDKTRDLLHAAIISHIEAIEDKAPRHELMHSANKLNKIINSLEKQAHANTV